MSVSESGAPSAILETCSWRSSLTRTANRLILLGLFISCLSIHWDGRASSSIICRCGGDAHYPTLPVSGRGAIVSDKNWAVEGARAVEHDACAERSRENSTGRAGDASGALCRTRPADADSGMRPRRAFNVAEGRLRPSEAMRIFGERTTGAAHRTQFLLDSSQASPRLDLLFSHRGRTTGAPSPVH